MAKMRLHGPSFAYSMTSLGAALINPVFSFYYVKVFLNHYHVPEGWFHVSQVVYMIWNAVNDPLFGYMQDNLDWVKSRRHSILYGAPFYALAFLLAWFPWGDYTESTWVSGLHLMVTLCCFDALFTFVLLAQCCLFTELSHNHEDRIRLVRYQQVASLIGSCSVFICEVSSNHLENFFNFQVVCVLLAIGSFLCMRYTGLHSYTQYDTMEAQSVKQEVSLHQEGTAALRANDLSIWRQTWQILKDRNFLGFVLMNFCQTFHAAYLSGFTIIFVDQLVPTDYIPSFARNSFYGSLTIIPQVFVILFAPLVGSYGYYNVIRSSFYFKIVLGVSLWFAGPQPWVILAYFMLDTIVTNTSYSLFNLPLSDIVDKDMERYARRHPLSSMVFGTNALVVKPAISLAPMIVVAILNQHYYKKVQMKTSLTSVEQESLHQTLFNIACTVPVFVGVIQLIFWSRYQLRKSHETVTKYVES